MAKGAAWRKRRTSRQLPADFGSGGAIAFGECFGEFRAQEEHLVWSENWICLGAARVTLLGTAAEVPATEVRDLYLSRYENARYWQEFSDFAYYRLEVSGVYFIGGFGAMGWVRAEEYGSARPDPLAESSPEIIRHMNADHADSLLLIARRFAGEEPDEASMTAVDRLGFHLRLKTGDRVHGCRVAFLREVGNQNEARAVLVEMVGLARSPASGS